jgi:acyl-CoA synthetase (NDP forming)
MNMPADRVWKLLKDWKIPVLPMMIASTPSDTVEMARQLGYPVAMKILAPDISHKSDVHGVILNLNSDKEVDKAYLTMMDSVKKHVPDARIDGVLLQKMAEPGLEVIVGVKLDPQFGHVVMFGLGGIFVEIYNDVSFRITPIDKKTALEMVFEIKGSSIIKGIRGKEPVDVEAIVNVITVVSNMIEKHPDILELDINPLIVYSRGAVAVDARILTR